jgi:hypothetical protein
MFPHQSARGIWNSVCSFPRSACHVMIEIIRRRIILSSDINTHIGIRKFKPVSCPYYTARRIYHTRYSAGKNIIRMKFPIVNGNLH